VRWRFQGPSRIAVRLLAFNLLLLFLPIAGLLYLDVYEARLLEAQERAMIQQGRLIAAAISPEGVLDADTARAFLSRLAQRGDARYRVYDPAGVLVADSNAIRLEAEEAASPSAGASYSQESHGVRAQLLYRIGAWIAGARTAAAAGLKKTLLIDRPRTPMSTTDPTVVPPEVRTALTGRYGAATRPSPGQRSLTLSSAIPIRVGSGTAGAVLVSQSTFRVLQALYSVRLRIFEVVVSSLVAAGLLTTLAAATVVRPISRLRREASDLAERRSRLPGTFRDVDRRDEIGDLARALQELTRRLDEHIREVERFASDVSHEFKNPLAAIRVAAEMAGAADAAGDRQRFLDLLMRDADRLERLVSDVRELARVDASLEQDPVQRVDVGDVLVRVIEGLRLSQGESPPVVLHGAAGGVRVRGSADRLAQAFENVVANARSFAPPETSVEIALTVDGGVVSIAVNDSGPGIPDAHLGRVFDRFFTYRPAHAHGREHAGLGLAIARSIVMGYGGTIAASNRATGGASIEMRLPGA
jgi:two-component system sensor histidine kinase ChvG